jgi:hypothetical protein
MIGYRRILSLALAAAGFLLCTASAPHYLRNLDAFRVRSVEVAGTRFLKPHDALEASGIAITSSVFDDPRVWRDSLLMHPLIQDAHVSRRPPGTVRIEVREREPVALVRTPRLQPVDMTGRMLPLDPAFGGIDLPILDGKVKVSAARVQDVHTLRTLEGLAAMRALQPTLWPWISEVQAGRGDMRLLLRWPEGAQLLLALPVDSARLEDVRLVLADLAAVGGAATNASDLTRLQRLDARFDDQILVALSSGTRARTREGS